MNRMFEGGFEHFSGYANADIFSKQNPTSVLRDNLRRIFIERGFDFFEKQKGASLEEHVLASGEPAEVKDAVKGDIDGNPTTKIMSTEELFNMRMEILPQLL
jgi:mediator of RNA polymerase II transcription subunit 17, fungi type